MAVDIVTARGHPNIKATHKSTLEITTEGHLTPKGDCIIAVNADKALADLHPALKEYIRRGYPLAIAIMVKDDPNSIDVFFAKGHRSLQLSDKKSIVVRKSNYIDARTLAIKATKAAKDIDRELVEKMKDPSTVVKIIIASAPTRLETIQILFEHLQKQSL